MNTKFVSLMIIGLILVVFPACVQAEPAASQTPPVQASTKVADATAKPAWQQDWEKTVAAAKGEGTLTILNVTGPETMEAWRDGFMKAYGIKTEFVTGGSAEVVPKLTMERQAGLFLDDIYISGTGQIFTIKPRGFLDPIKPILVLPEVVDPKAWYGGNGPPFLDNEKQYVQGMSLFTISPIVVNSDLVKPEDIRANKDLLNPRWKGQLVMHDPSMAAGGGRQWAGMTYMALGADYMKQFAKQEPVVTRDARQQTEWVARGKYSAMVGVDQSAVAEFLKAQAPLRQVVPTDAAYGGSGLALSFINKAPHPNAAKVFLNWILTKEGQTIHSKSALQQSTRLDVPTDGLPAVTLRQPGITYMNSSAEDIYSKRDTAADEAMKFLAIVQ